MTEIEIWQTSLLIGGIVLVAVVALLSVLLYVVRDVNRNVFDLWTATKRVATNTTGLYQLAGTASIVRALREELLRQEKLLGGGR